ncbi:MAG: thiosulfate oxidation carrier protein SoxY [Gammaproteobacteria bacterium SG8_47]|nr:MAG: thiosulfate oxidation carrier protein SoxY [Gammaproteobacteria bacterium SG8_47]
MYQKRRTFLKATLATGAVAVAAGAGLLSPRAVLAAWPQGAFEAKSVDDAVGALIGNAAVSESGDITVKAPDIAENGAVVSVTVESTLSGIESIAVLARENTTPLAASYLLADTTDGFISSRIKMRKTSEVLALVKAGGKVYSAKKEVKVTLGGCGG